MLFRLSNMREKWKFQLLLDTCMCSFISVSDVINVFFFCRNVIIISQSIFSSYFSINKKNRFFFQSRNNSLFMNEILFSVTAKTSLRFILRRCFLNFFLQKNDFVLHRTCMHYNSYGICFIFPHFIWAFSIPKYFSNINNHFELITTNHWWNERERSEEKKNHLVLCNIISTWRKSFCYIFFIHQLWWFPYFWFHMRKAKYLSWYDWFRNEKWKYHK